MDNDRQKEKLVVTDYEADLVLNLEAGEQKMMVFCNMPM